MNDLMTSHPIGGHRFPNLEMLDAKITSHFKKRGSLEEQRTQMQDRFLRGRQIAKMIYEHFPSAGVLDCSDLFGVSVQGDDIQDFDTRWDQALLSTSETRKDNQCSGKFVQDANTGV